MSNEAHPLERLRFLDALRGFAVVWIVLFHMVLVPNPNIDTPVWASAWVRVGDMGVTLFFLITGFSICYTMKLHQGEPRPQLSFYIRRFFRIAPLFYMLLLVTIVYDWASSGIHYTFLRIAADFLFLFNVFPGKQEGIVWASWYIGVLMFLYLLSPFVYKLFNNAWKAAIFIFLSILMAYTFKYLLIYFPFDPDVYFRWSFIRHLPIFAFGIFVYYILTMISSYQLKYKRSMGFFMIGASLFLFIELLLKRQNVLELYYWQAISFSALLLGLALNPLKILVNDYTTYLGKLSFSMYLCHPLLIRLLIPLYRYIYKWQVHLSIRYLMIVCITLTLLIGISFFTYRLIEQPGIRFGKKFLIRDN